MNAPTTSPSEEEQEETRKKIMYFFAREIWNKRLENIPNKNQSWSDRFEEMFHQKLIDYVDYAKENNLKEKYTSERTNKS